MVTVNKNVKKNPSGVVQSETVSQSIQCCSTISPKSMYIQINLKAKFTLSIFKIKILR